MAGHFIISLDFELMWGVLDHSTMESYGVNIKAVHQVMPQMLSLFSKYGINATVAYVGFLEFAGRKELLSSLPPLRPQYLQPILSPYRDDFDYVDGCNEYFFAPELIAMMSRMPNIELATHTFCHYYCNAQGQTKEEFEADLDCAVKSGEKVSIVFPRNQVSDEYLAVLPEYGIKYYRGNPKRLFKQDGGKLQRILRLADTYLNLTGANSYKREELSKNSIPLNIPASRFFKPYSRTLSFLEGLKVRRITSAMKVAAKRDEMFHLWWHPHNFGANSDKNLEQLEKILKCYQKLNYRYGFESTTMKMCGIFLKRDDKVKN